MSLSRFKRTIIKLDKANNRIPQVILGKEGDYYGRELEVHLLDDGERVDTTGVDLNFQWKNLRSGEFGALPFEEEDAAKGTYTIAYPPEMLTKGDVSCAVQIIEGGSITHTMNFKVSVEGNPLDSEVLMEDNSFKTLGEALVKINSLKQQFDDAVGAITEDSEVILARDGFPTLGERLDSQKEDYANYQSSNNLKIASVEKELNDYKSTMASVNVNQEAKQTTSGYGIVGLPKNSANGNVSVSTKGFTATNLINNGVNYSNWQVSGAGTTKSENGIHLVADGAHDLAIVPILNIKPNTLYTLIYTIKQTNLVSIFSIAGSRSSFPDTTLTQTLGQNKVLITSKDVLRGDIGLFLSSANIDGTYINFSDVMLLEGDWTDRGNVPYFDGTKSAQSASRLKSVSEDETQESTQYIPNVGELRSLPNGIKDEIRVSGGKAELVKRVSDTMEELAEPIVTPVEVSGTLLSNPSGAVYVEPVVADAGIYDEGISVLHQDLPINYIEGLSKVDFTTGLETELDAAQCVIAEDKLSFTHTDLTIGDIVFFTYYYDLESTLGETTIEYYDSRHTLKDSVTGKFYKVVPAVEDGVLTNQLVEV